MSQSFSTRQVASLTGTSVRQIDYWARTGLIRPSAGDGKGRGSKRRYSFLDIISIQTVGKLRESKCPLQKIRAAVRHLKSHYPSDADVEVLARTVLLTDGQKVYVLKDQDEVMEVVTRQRVWSIPLGKLISETKARIERIPKQWRQAVTVHGKKFHLDIVEDPESREFSVQCIELPGAIEQGRSIAEAVSNGQLAIESVLDFQAQRARVTRGAGHVKIG
jgi:DNA-binding transcriptional MerR regulator